MIKYSDENKKESFDLSYGLAGIVGATKRSYIINDVRLSSQFNNLVDIDSKFPL